MKTADQRVREAIDEAKEQLAKGWTAREVLVVLEDAYGTIAAVREEERFAGGEQ